MTLGRLFLLFVAVPLADLTLLVWAGGQIGFWPTVAIVVLTAAAGSWLARREGSAAWRRVNGKLASGGVPGPELIDGLIILVAGVLLLTPGFLTDVVGFLGLLPPSRAIMRRVASARFQKAVREGRVRMASGGMGGFGARGFGPG
ncbi:MAG: FxsA family protein, partial [Bacteroidota bacterium]